MNAYIFSTPEKQIELGLNAEQLTQFNTYKTQYNTSFAAYLDPAKRTKVIYSEHKTTQSVTLNLDSPLTKSVNSATYLPATASPAAKSAPTAPISHSPLLNRQIFSHTF